MTRDQRKHEALKTCVARPVEAEGWLDTVHVFRPGRWARVNLFWDPARDDEFLGPVRQLRTPAGRHRHRPPGARIWCWTCSLYPDGNWDWKDSEEFDRALDDQLFAPELRPILEREAELVLAERDRGDGPFDPGLLALRPEPEAAAILPPDYAPDGERWRRSYPVEPIPPPGG